VKASPSPGPLRGSARRVDYLLPGAYIISQGSAKSILNGG
jgi:hypothetical protein